MESLRNTLRKLRWGLTLSYTAVTIGSLLVAGLIFGTTLFSRIMVPDLWLTSDKGIGVANRSAVPIMRNILSQSPIIMS